MVQKQSDTHIVIIGQGLAGTCLSYQFYAKNSDFIVIDNSHYRSSSTIAAGLINPVVFKRLTKSWKADDLMPYLELFYEKIEKLLGVSFYEKKTLLRVLNSVEEINTWDGKRKGEFANYLSQIISSSAVQIPLKQEVNLGKVKAASIDLPIFLNSWKTYLKLSKRLIEEKINYDQIGYDKNGIEIQLKGHKIKANKIVFCEGALGADNPLFKWLPFNLSKGDMLTLKNNAYLGNEVLNNGKFFLPKKDGTIKMGSTYRWDNLSYETTQEGEKELFEKVEETLSGTSTLINHEVGIRPTVKDRRPMLGRHPTIKNAYIFNGLGTKGAMLAPYYSEQMFNYMIRDEKLNKEVDIKRFSHLFDTFFD
ncbi:MAG: FAD-binding oxidoreductase [Flavobacteriales bacterium]|nr:FAD-binding oxidoreductase [Flavobacteriales bacterium]